MCFHPIKYLPTQIGETSYYMVFMVVDIDNYNVLLGLDVLINIGARMDIKEA
jgi:hypothetical protein